MPIVAWEEVWCCGCRTMSRMRPRTVVRTSRVLETLEENVNQLDGPLPLPFAELVRNLEPRTDGKVGEGTVVDDEPNDESIVGDFSGNDLPATEDWPRVSYEGGASSGVGSSGRGGFSMIMVKQYAPIAAFWLSFLVRSGFNLLRTRSGCGVTRNAQLCDD